MQENPTASLCSLERVVRLPAYRGASGRAETEDAYSGGVMTGAAAGAKALNEAGDVPNRKGRDDGSGPSGNRRVLARTRNKGDDDVQRDSGPGSTIEAPKREELLA